MKTLVRKITACAALLGAALFLSPTVALAQTAQDTFQVTITLLDNCTISADDLDFGSANGLGSNIDATADITVNCTSTTAYQVALDDGANVGRTMVNGLEDVDYELYRDAARTLVWGATGGVNTNDGVGTAANQTLTVYGRVPAQTTPPPNTYTDTVTATISF